MNNSLVHYYSSDEETEAPVPPTKRRKLPQLSSLLSPSTPVDDPAQHDGRMRTIPFVEGQWAAYVYVPVSVHPKSPLSRLMGDIMGSASTAVPTLRAVGAVASNRQVDLHISLSRPIYIRAHQRDELKRSVKAIAEAHHTFTASFATFSELVNDEKTRSFLTVEVGAGHDKIKHLSDALTPVLRGLRQKTFYEEPRFHASIAWALLDPPTTTIPGPGHAEQRGTDSPKQKSELGYLASDSLPQKPPKSTTPGPMAEHPELTPVIAFPTIPSLPATLVQTLISSYGTSLASTKTGTFEVDRLCVRIGKDVSSWALR